MKRYKRALLCFVILCLGVNATGCTKKINEKTIKSTDGVCEISVPNTWNNKDGLNDKAIIQLADKDSSLICVPYKKSDIETKMSVDELAKLTEEELKSIASNSKVSHEENIKVNNVNSKYYEVEGDVQNEKASYSVVITEGKDSYYEIITYCLTANQDKNRATYKNILTSFKEVK